MKKKYICVSTCPELDGAGEAHCTTFSPKTCFVEYPDGCPIGNTPHWVNEENCLYLWNGGHKNENG